MKPWLGSRVMSEDANRLVAAAGDAILRPIDGFTGS